LIGRCVWTEAERNVFPDQFGGELVHTEDFTTPTVAGTEIKTDRRADLILKAME